MERGKVANEIIEFQKATFNNTFNTMVMLQDQTNRMANVLLEQATWLPEEGKKAIDKWVETYKKGREDFKKAVEDNFKRVEDFFSS